MRSEGRASPLPIIIQAAKRLPTLLTSNSTLLTFVKGTSINYCLHKFFFTILFLLTTVKYGVIIMKNKIFKTVDAEIKANKPSQRALLLRKGKKHLSNGPLRVQSNAATYGMRYLPEI